MTRHCLVALALLALAGPHTLPAQAPSPEIRLTPEMQALQMHFERTVAARHAALFRDIETPAQFDEYRRRRRRDLERMLWHDLEWPAAPPPARITHRTAKPAYFVENLVLETAPGVYATANLFLPRRGRGPFPLVLYQCGHAAKHLYAHHGAWFATHGLAALVLDTIEMGEIEFTHHGVYAKGWYHWYSRGFSPLAVELLNARRALDYLVTRPDIDRDRIGATGRSGGGMTTFFLAALDERVRAAAPVSGTLSTAGFVRRRLAAAHCDCQYPVNAHALHYAEAGALIAPRPQLLVNADADPGFPMDAFTEMIEPIRRVYRLHAAENALRTAVTSGGHRDTEAIRLPVYSFFLKELAGIDAPVTAEGPLDAVEPEALVCFRGALPLDERLTRIDETLLPASPPRLDRGELAATLRREVFRYFPAAPAPLEPAAGAPAFIRGRTVTHVTFTSFEGLRVRARYSVPAPTAAALPGLVYVDHRKGIPVWGNEQPVEENDWGARAVLVVETLDRGSRALETNLRSAADDDLIHHMRRQAMVAGTTLESMQVYEILRSLEWLRAQPEVDTARIAVTGSGEDGVNALYAALLDGRVEHVVLGSPPPGHRHGPHYLGVLRYTDIPTVAALMAPAIRLYGEVPPSFDGTLRRCASLAACLAGAGRE